MNLLLLASIAVLAVASVVYRCLRRQPHDTNRSILRNVLAGVAVYGLVGPAIGLLGAIAILYIPDSLYSFDGVRAAYLFGATPAVLCGLTAGAFKPAQAAWRPFAWVCGAGALYGFFFMLSILGMDRIGYVVEAFKAGALPGFAAAVVCTLLFHGRPWKTAFGTPQEQ
ncbi:MAG: hypothetical protein ACREX5_19525 [Achromobacter pestifer]